MFLPAEPGGPGSSVSRQIPQQICETNTPYSIVLRISRNCHWGWILRLYRDLVGSGCSTVLADNKPTRMHVGPMAYLLAQKGLCVLDAHADAQSDAQSDADKFVHVHDIKMMGLMFLCRFARSPYLAEPCYLRSRAYHIFFAPEVDLDYRA